MWQTTIRNATNSSPELINLFPNAIKIINSGDWDYLISTLKITEGYILLCKNDFMNVRKMKNFYNI